MYVVVIVAGVTRLTRPIGVRVEAQRHPTPCRPVLSLVTHPVLANEPARANCQGGGAPAVGWAYGLSSLPCKFGQTKHPSVKKPSR